MLSLILAILSSAAVSVVMRTGEARIRGTMGMFAVNYAVCACLSLAFAGGIRPADTAGMAFAAGLGLISGVLYLTSFAFLKFNIHYNGLAMASTFMKLGVVITTLIAIFIFREQPKLTQTLGILLAAAAILMLHAGGGEEGDRRFLWFLPLLTLCGGVTDAMANVYEKIGAPALKDTYLAITFGAAFVCALLMCLIRHEKAGKAELLWGILIGIPNYFSSRFLLAALAALPAVVVYPVINASVILLTAAAGRCFFGERPGRRKLAAMMVILAALILLNL